jgi:hypothetical protein
MGADVANIRKCRLKVGPTGIRNKPFTLPEPWSDSGAYIIRSLNLHGLLI